MKTILALAFALAASTAYAGPSLNFPGNSATLQPMIWIRASTRCKCASRNPARSKPWSRRISMSNTAFRGLHNA